MLEMFSIGDHGFYHGANKTGATNPYMMCDKRRDEWCVGFNRGVAHMAELAIIGESDAYSIWTR